MCECVAQIMTASQSTNQPQDRTGWFVFARKFLGEKRLGGGGEFDPNFLWCWTSRGFGSVTCLPCQFRWDPLAQSGQKAGSSDGLGPTCHVPTSSKGIEKRWDSLNIRGVLIRGGRLKIQSSIKATKIKSRMWKSAGFFTHIILFHFPLHFVSMHPIQYSRVSYSPQRSSVNGRLRKVDSVAYATSVCHGAGHGSSYIHGKCMNGRQVHIHHVHRSPD